MAEESKQSTLKETLTAKEKIAQEKNFWLIKVVRQYPDPYAFWRSEAQSLTITAKTPEFQSKRPLRYGGEENLYTLRIDGVQKVKAEPLYEKKEKWGFSKHKSMTAVSTTHKFCPPAFSFNLADINSVEVGYMLPAESNYALIRRILQNGGGTIHRNFRYKTERKAKAALEEGLNNNTIFTSLSALAKKGDKTTFNEAMVHAKWGPKAKIAYFRDNLPSKMRAISLAHDMSVRLRQQQMETGEKCDVKDSKTSQLPAVEICSYLPENDNKSASIQSYTPTQQQEDIARGLLSADPKTKAFARFVELQKNDFKIKEDDEDIKIEELEIFIKLAADLSYESSILFFENFFLPQQDKIQGNLAQTNKLHLLRDVFRCVPLEERQRLIHPRLKTPDDKHSDFLKAIPNLRGYYLHSLLRFDCLEHDVNELLELLEKEPNINLEILGEYKPENRKWKIVEVQDRNGDTLLHLAAVRNKRSVVERLLKNKALINAKNKDGKTALDLAFESGHMELTKYLLDQRATFKDGRTLLHMAAWKNKMDIVQSIISSSSNKDAIINSRDCNGITPLHLAAEAGNYDVVKFLLDNGAYSHCTDDLGKTPLYCTDSPAVAKLLIEKGVYIFHEVYDYENSKLMDAIDRAVITNNIDMMKVLMETPMFLQFGDVKCYLAKAIEHNCLVAADFLIGHVKYSSASDIEHFVWKNNPLYNAVKNKNDAILDFLLTKDSYPFLSSYFYFNKVFLTTTSIIVAGSVIAYFSSPKEFQELIAHSMLEGPLDLSPVSISLIVIGIAFTYALMYCIFANDKKEVDEKVTEYRASKTIHPLRGYTFMRFGLSPDASVEETVSHLGKLPLREAATQLLNIAEVDPKFALYSIIRLFNSDTQKASEILYHISQSQLSKENFLKLFDEPCSDEREVLIGCIKERIEAGYTQQAEQIFNMFSSGTQQALLEKIDHHKLYPKTPQPDMKPLSQLSFDPRDKDQKLNTSGSFQQSSSRDILFPVPGVKDKKLSADPKDTRQVIPFTATSQSFLIPSKNI